MNKTQSGFTLLEVMIAMAIVGILLTVTLTGTKDIIEKDRASNFLEEFKRNLLFARGKASVTDETVVVCPVANPSSKSNCSDTWSTNPIVIFVDTDTSTAGEFDPANDMLLRVMDKINSNDLIKSTGSALTFNGEGRILTSQIGEFIFCPNKKATESVTLAISASGRARNMGKNGEACS